MVRENTLKMIANCGKISPKTKSRKKRTLWRINNGNKNICNKAKQEKWSTFVKN